MSSTEPELVLETGSDGVRAVAFHPDGKHVFTGTRNGIQRWQLADGQEAARQTGIEVLTVSVSSDQRWVVCGAEHGASVWDAELREKGTEVEGVNVYATDIAPDSTRFATGTLRGNASIWNIITGERLVGPLECGGDVLGTKFSPDGRYFATASDADLLIFDSHSGAQLVSIKNRMHYPGLGIPVAWSVDGLQLFAASTENKIKSFDPSTGAQLAEWYIHENDDSMLQSIVISPNNSFIASKAGRLISIWDASNHAQLGVVQDDDAIESIALSPDGSRLAGGSKHSGSVVIWNLSSVLPKSYLSVDVDQSAAQQGSRSQPGRTERGAVSQGNREDDVLQTELSLTTSAPGYGFDEPPSLASHKLPPDLPLETGIPKPSPGEASSPKRNKGRMIGSWSGAMKQSVQVPQRSSSLTGRRPLVSTYASAEKLQTMGKTRATPARQVQQPAASSSKPAASGESSNEKRNVSGEKQPEVPSVQVSTGATSNQPPKANPHIPVATNPAYVSGDTRPEPAGARTVQVEV